ncbi:MAG: NAD(P)/FAD-dependent oxidoreductase [Byssovorax sp.]
MEPASPTPDVVVVGGGFVGMTAAAALADGKRSVLVLEARAGADPRFRGELLHPRGVAVLADLGLLGPLLRAGGAEVEGFAVVPAPGEDAVLLPYGGADARGLSMDHPPMVACLRREVSARPGVTLRSGARVGKLLRDGDRVVGVETAEGEQIHAELTVIADGRHSKLRGELGIEEEATLLSFTAAVLVHDVALPHAGHGHVFLGAPGPVLAYPLAGGRARMCVDIPLGAEKGKAALAALLERAYAPFVPEPLRGGMLRAIAQGDLEVCANHAIRTRRCTAPGAALVGDAAGCCHPLTAAGMTLGLHDVGVLSDELSTAPTFEAARLGYERRRYRFARGREALTDALYPVMRGGDRGLDTVQRGMIDYWRSSERARRASMGLLSGQESRLGVFAAEYLRVVGRAARGVLRGRTDDASLRGRAASMTALLQRSYLELERNVGALYHEAIDRRSPSIQA